MLSDRLQMLQSNTVVGLVAITDAIKRHELKLQWNVIIKHRTHQGNKKHHCKQNVLFVYAKRFYVSVGHTMLLIKVCFQTIQ
jgi:hypothetical protein